MCDPWMTSFLLPSSFHVFQATHISHRGGAGERIENTLAAFRNAYQVGTDMFELDCQVTKDGQVRPLNDKDC